MPATYKRVRIGESQIQAVRDAIEIRIVYLESFEKTLKDRNEQSAAQHCFNQRSALVHFLYDLNKNPWSL